MGESGDEYLNRNVLLRTDEKELEILFQKYSCPLSSKYSWGTGRKVTIFRWICKEILAICWSRIFEEYAHMPFDECTQNFRVICLALSSNFSLNCLRGMWKWCFDESEIREIHLLPYQTWNSMYLYLLTACSSWHIHQKLNISFARYNKDS